LNLSQILLYFAKFQQILFNFNEIQLKLDTNQFHSSISLIFFFRILIDKYLQYSKDALSKILNPFIQFLSFSFSFK